MIGLFAVPDVSQALAAAPAMSDMVIVDPGAKWLTSDLTCVVIDGKVSFRRMNPAAGSDLDLPPESEVNAIVKEDVRYSFTADIWQSREISLQTELYRQLKEKQTELPGSPEIKMLELPSQSNSSGGAVTRRLVVEREFTLSSGPFKVHAVLRSTPEVAHTIRFELPAAFDPAGLAQPTPWVHFPTTYRFIPLGSMRAKGLEFASRATAITLLENHIKEFMRTRELDRDAIAGRVDGIAADTIEGKQGSQLPGSLLNRLISAIPPAIMRGVTSGDAKAWLRDARVTKLETTILLEESGVGGQVIDIEVP